MGLLLFALPPDSHRRLCPGPGWVFDTARHLQRPARKDAPTWIGAGLAPTFVISIAQQQAADQMPEGIDGAFEYTLRLVGRRHP